MELTVETKVVKMKEEGQTQTAEHALDCELLLPDYNPDIARVLKCRGEPKILLKQVTDGQLTIEGAVAVELLYTEEGGGLCFTCQNLPFYHELPLAGAEGGAAVTAKMAYCNCRVVTPRKVELHGAVSLKARGQQTVEQTLVTGLKGGGAQVCTEAAVVTGLLGECEKTATVSEEVTLPGEPLRTLLRTAATVQEAECKMVGGKAVVKGALALTALYEKQEGGYETLRARLPFSQVLDLPGCEEADDCRLFCRVSSLELRTRTALDGACKNLLVTAGVQIAAACTKTERIEAVVDAYATGGELALRRCGGRLTRLTKRIDEPFTCGKEFSLGRAIREVIDVWGEITDQRLSIEAGRVRAAGMASLSILALDSDGTPVFLEKALDFSCEIPVEAAGEVTAEGAVELEEVHFSLTGDSAMELNASLRLTGRAYERLTISPVCEAELTPAERQKPEAPLVIYYAQGGERVFDVARRYNTTCAAVSEANGLTEPVIPEARALLVPVE